MKARPSALALAAVIAVSSPAFAHIVLVSPPPRDVGMSGADAHKNGPCGGVLRTAKYTQYAPGASVAVNFIETVDHRGCFQVAFSESGDTGFTILPGSQTDDPAGDTTPKAHSITVTLPTTPCKQCTLQVRQLMINQACTPGQAPGASDTYYTCADICIGTDCPVIPPADAGTTSSSSSSSGGSSSGVSTTPVPPANPTSEPTSTGGSSGTPRLDTGKGHDGCAVGWGSPARGTACAVVGVALAALLRRRRRDRLT